MRHHSRPIGVDLCVRAADLVLNGARTELIGVVALSVTVEFMLSRRKWLMFVMAASLVAIAIAALPILADFYPESRTIFLFLDYSDDLSKIERTRMLEDGWNSIQQSPGWARSAATGPANIFTTLCRPG